jgi:two-component system, NtrC family, response regulator
MSQVLIIDDDEMYSHMLFDLIERSGHEPSMAFTLKDGLQKARENDFDVVFLDVNMPDGNGLESLPYLRHTPSAPEVIIITGAGDPDGAELAIKSGAWDYIEKGASLKEITLPLVRALQYRRDKNHQAAPTALKAEGIIGQSPKLKTCFEVLSQAAASDASVLITGESGTGKELFARAIHDNSLRVNNNFVVIDCAALPPTLVESELFGYERGAFTGADRSQKGLVMQAHQGTLFLDEVGELPLSIQSAFLRVLQEHRFRAVGGQRENISDFRLVAATNRNLGRMVENGQFRNDLLYRLKSFVIELPPLRELVPDIKEIAIHHTERLCKRAGLEVKNFSPEFLDILTSYHWPGNVRELVNTLERSIAAARYEPTLYQTHLPESIRIHMARSSVTGKSTPPKTTPEPTDKPSARLLPTLQEVRAEAERNYLRSLVEATRGRIGDACRISGLSRSRLYELLQKYDISR